LGFRRIVAPAAPASANGKAAAGTNDDDLVTARDIASTIADVLG
jgi:hypothetical protein